MYSQFEDYDTTNPYDWRNAPEGEGPTVRLANAFLTNKLTDVRDIAMMTELQFFQTKNVGRKTIRDAKDFLAQYGLSFREGESDPVTKIRFIEKYCKVHEIPMEHFDMQKIAVPCYCPARECQGWAVVPRFALSHN